jgi:hypothetical protein
MRWLRWLSWAMIVPFVLFALLVVWIGLGFNWAWWLLSLGPVLVVGVALRANRARVRVIFGFVLIGATLISASLTTWFRTYLNPRPEIINGAHPIALEWSHGTALMERGYYTLDDVNQTQYVLFQPTSDGLSTDDISLQISFDPVPALDGKWALANASVTVSNSQADGAFDGNYPTQPHPIDWDAAEINPDSPIQADTQPFVALAFPLADAPLYERFTLKATAEVVYPIAPFENRTETRTRMLTIFVASPTDFDARQAYNQWQKIERLAANGGAAIWGVLIAGGVFIVWGILAAPRRKSSNYSDEG